MELIWGISPTLCGAYGGPWSRLSRSGSVRGAAGGVGGAGLAAALSCDRLEREVLTGGGNVERTQMRSAVSCLSGFFFCKHHKHQLLKWLNETPGLTGETLATTFEQIVQDKRKLDF